ncbi:MAG: hypothetical protein PUB20_00095 [Clostridia bacterium]|nr:hypothetical protein [Clostridia bacterium]
MARVVVNVQNYMFADMISSTLSKGGDFSVSVVEKPENLIAEFNRTAANSVLMEVADCDSWKIDKRMELVRQIKKTDPYCKTVFLVDEKKEPDTAEKVRRAKLDGLIDQFIYDSVSAAYLLGVMETL